MVPANPLTADLDESQAAAVTFSDDRPLCVLAGPGSGKTRVLTRRIAYRCETGSAAPEHTIAVTFTRKAALELRHRLAAMGMHDAVVSGTLHSLAYAELRKRWRDQGVRPPTLLSRSTRAVAQILPDGTDMATIRDAAEELAWAAAMRLSSQSYAAAADRGRRRTALSGDDMSELIDSYRRWKAEQRVIDFDDLLAMFTSELTGDADYQAAIRWRHRHFHVDEFQDLNPLQFALLKAWAELDLFAVGDPNQAIFGWNGADAAYLTQFVQHFPSAEVIRLERTYRSTPEIIAGAYAVLDPDKAKVQPECSHPSGDKPTVTEYADELEETTAIARRVRDLHGPGGVWSNQAVLVRTRDQFGTVAEALRKAAIPHLVRDDVGFANLPEITTTLDAIFRADRALATEVADLRTELGQTPPGDDEPEEIEKRANLVALCELGADQLLLDPEASGRSFVSWVRSTYRNQGLDSAGDAVEIVTFHAAKGLEWGSVHIAGAERGLVPIHHAVTSAQRAEERRLLFVAMTRAQQNLHISWARTRQFDGTTYERSRSPLLAPLLESCCCTEGEPAATISSPQIATAVPDPESALRTALESWRSSAARAADVTPQAVLADAAINALCANPPSNADEVIEVSGMSQLRARRFAPDLIAVITANS